MTKNPKAIKCAAEQATLPTKHHQVVSLLSREGGATLNEMSNLANWLTHSTRAFLTGLKKRGYDVDSNKVDGVRHYRITKAPVA